MPNEATNTKPKRGKRTASSMKTYLTKFRGSHKLGTLALIISIIALITAGLLYYISIKLNNQLDSLNNQIKKIETEIKLLANQTKLLAILTQEGKEIVDLTEPTIQGIGNGFMVARLSVEQHLTGVKIKGLVINSTSLTQESVEFQIKIAGQIKDFTINRISAGGSTTFEVYVPDVPIAQTKLATIKYNRSMVRYF